MRLIWATRGRVWGFQFLRDGGFDDPLPVYEEAFQGVAVDQRAFGHSGEMVALRFPDPLGRQDAAGRVIPHEFVVFSPLADQVNSVEDGFQVVWPLVRGEYARVWRKPKPPSTAR